MRTHRSKPDLLQTALGLGIELTKIGQEYVGRVPWRDDEKPSLQINPEKQ